MDSRTEADRWLQLRHTGQNAGIGVVEWDAEAKGRYLARLKQAKPIPIQVLDIVETHGSLSETAKHSERKIVDAIRRIVTDADAQAALGYQIINNKIHSYFPPEEVAKGLTKIVEDFKTGRKNTNNIHSKKDRKSYLREFTPAHRPDPASKKTELRELETGVIATGVQPKVGHTRRQAPQPERKSIVPSEFRINIPHHRLNMMYLELKKLRFEGNINAIGVMFRAFLEMSVDEFVINNGITISSSTKRQPRLSDKLLAVADHLENLSAGKAWSKAKLRPIRKFASVSHLDSSNVDTLHAWVHDRNLSPTPSELRLVWNNIQRFIQLLWE